MTASGESITSSPRRAQRSSPNDSRNGSQSRALTALLESWVNDSRDARFPGEAPSRGQESAVRRRAGSTTTARNGRVSPVARTLPLRSLRRPQASSNTYPTGLTPLQQRAALWRLSTTLYEGKRSMARKRIKRHNGKLVKDGMPVVDPSLENLAAVLEAIAAMDALPLVPSPPPRRRRRRCAT